MIDSASFLAAHNEGQTIRKINTELAELLSEVDRLGKSGTIAITIKFTSCGVYSGQQFCAIDTKVTAPRPDPASKLCSYDRETETLTVPEQLTLMPTPAD